MARFLIIVLALVVLLGTAATAFVAGHVVNSYQWPPTEQLQRAERSLLRRMPTLAHDPLQDEAGQIYESIWVRLQGNGTRLVVGRPGSGGGMASLGEHLLLLAHEGTIFSATSAEDVRATAIRPPENGFDDYLAATELPAYRDYIHEPHRLRYNDLLLAETDTQTLLVISYTEFDGSEVCYRNAVATLPIVGSDPDALRAGPEDWEVVWRSQPCLPFKRMRRALEGHIAGGRMAFEAPSTLYTANGDYHWDGVRGPEALAQDPEVDYGKVMAIDLTTGEARQIASGLRNPQGIVLDAAGGLWTAEHGPRGGDELNYIVEGSDYGWPSETLGTNYDGLPWPLGDPHGRHDTFTPPALAWLPSIAPSAMTLVDGFHESWDGDIVLATLRAQSLYRIRVLDDRVVFAEPIPIGKRVRSVHQHSDGRIVLWTDDHFLIFLSPQDGSRVRDLIAEFIDSRPYSDAQAARVSAAIEGCQQCHSFEQGSMADQGWSRTDVPHLGGIYNAPIASSNHQWYSPALRAKSGRWTPENLAAYLTDPAGWAPGTSMPQTPDTNPFVIDELVALLAFFTEAGD